jgi:hypothetical protein
MLVSLSSRRYENSFSLPYRSLSTLWRSHQVLLSLIILYFTPSSRLLQTGISLFLRLLVPILLLDIFSNEGIGSQHPSKC